MELAGGYVKLYRKLIENPVWTQLSPAVLKVMFAFLIKANWKPATWYDGRSEIQIPRGSFVTSYPKMAEFCSLTPKQVRAAFDHLQRLHFAAYTRAAKWTMVTVLNYSTYQDVASEEGTVEGSLGAGSGHDEGTMRAPIEEVKKGRTTLSASGGDGGGAPLVLVPPDSNEKGCRSAASRKPYADVLEQVARSIHDRHPNGFERRNLSAAAVAKKLGTILKYRGVAAGEAEAYLLRIDRNHVGACASDGWTKDGGQYAKGLRGWLSTREELYDVETAAPARKEPVRLMA
jgi:hypothetical protein